jgi:hypothetical protein
MIMDENRTLPPHAYTTPTRDELRARLRARHAARLAARDPIAVRMQAARDRAESEQRERDRIERERILALIGDAPKDEAAPVKPKRRRKPNVARFIKAARKAGEKGVVRVTVVDPSGFAVTVNSGGGDQGESDTPMINPWDVVSKRAAH